MVTKRIVLTKAAKCWMADEIGNRELFDMFGTTNLPTAFTEKAHPEIVRAAIEKFNPGAIVEVR